jgi:radical SAM protein with 4Fe4S-binding SPASM domain
MLDTESFRSILDEVSEHSVYLTFYFQGEPFLNPDFLEMVTMAKAKKLFVATSTNAHYLSSEKAKSVVESGLNRMIISIDGISQESYEKYRIGGSLEKVLEGAKNLVYWKKKLNSSTPHLTFQFLVLRHNEHEIEHLHALAREYGVNEVSLKTAQVYDYENGSDLIPSNEAYARYVKNEKGTFVLKNKLLNHCWKMWHSCVITWDGKVVPCCFDKDATHQMGNINEKSFDTIWKSDEYNRFRSSLLKGRNEIDICKNCSEGLKVWAS